MQKAQIYLFSDVNINQNTDNDTRTFSGIANSGKPFLHNGKWTIVDFDNLTFADNVPALLEHDRAKRIGFGQLSVKDNQLNIVGNLLNNELGQQIAQDADGGFPFQMSIHAIPKQVITLTGLQTAVVNGQTVQAPITILKNCRIAEVSFTPTGVDNNTSAVILSNNFNFHPQEHDMENENPTNTGRPNVDNLYKTIAELKTELERLKQDNADLMAKNEQLKANQTKVEVDAKLSQIGFKKDDKGGFIGISPNTYNVLLSQKAEDVDAMLGDLKPKKSNAPDYLFSEQFTGGSNEQGSENDLVAMAKSRNKQ